MCQCSPDNKAVLFCGADDCVWPKRNKKIYGPRKTALTLEALVGRHIVRSGVLVMPGGDKDRTCLNRQYKLVAVTSAKIVLEGKDKTTTILPRPLWDDGKWWEM